MSNADKRMQELSKLVAQENWTVGVVIKDMYVLYELFFYVDSMITFQNASCHTWSNLELKIIMEEVPLVLKIFLDEEHTVEDLFHCALSSTKTCHPILTVARQLWL